MERLIDHSLSMTWEKCWEFQNGFFTSIRGRPKSSTAVPASLSKFTSKVRRHINWNKTFHGWLRPGVSTSRACSFQAISILSARRDWATAHAPSETPMIKTVRLWSQIFRDKFLIKLFVRRKKKISLYELQWLRKLAPKIFVVIGCNVNKIVFLMRLITLVDKC